MGTSIEWTHKTVNLAWGCEKVSPGCAHCYAERISAVRASHPNPKIAAMYEGVVDSDGHWTGRVNLTEKFPTLPRKGRRIFVGSMSDLFQDGIPDEFLLRLWKWMEGYPQHTFQILTKRVARMADFLQRYAPEPLSNVWGVATVCNQDEADINIPHLMRAPLAVRGLSIEPVLDSIDLIGWGNIRQKKHSYPKTWSEFQWPEWVPEKLRKEIEGFWSKGCGQGPQEWESNAVQNEGGIEIGSWVGLDYKTYNSPIVRPPLDPRCSTHGRFVFAWNNMCRVVFDDGTYEYASFGGRYYLSKYLSKHFKGYKPLIHWVICGGETGPGARPMHPDWVRSLRDQCQAAGTAFFFKSWGEWTTDGAYVQDTPFADAGKRRSGRLLDGVEYSEFPEGAC